MAVLRYRIDVFSVVAVLLTVSLQITAVVDGWSPWALVPIMIGCRQCALVQHNHAHLRIFRMRALNELLGDLAACAMGVPLVFYEAHHVINHHRHYRDTQGTEDWSSPYGYSGCRYPDRPVARWYYILAFPLTSNLACSLFVVRHPGTHFQHRAGRSVAMMFALAGVLAWFDLPRTLLFLCLPWLIVSLGLGANSYDGHVGCALEHEETSANSCLGLHCRGFGYNIGYHVAHHVQPCLHWSRLPHLHAQIFKHRAPPAFRNWGLLGVLQGAGKKSP